MGPDFETLAWRGHRYDVRVLGASFEYLALRSSAERARAAGQDGSAAGLLAMDAYEIVLAQARDVHELAREHPDGDVCSCGVVTPPGLPLARATGHLDQLRWEPVPVVLVTTDVERRYESEPATALACCQDCGWTSPELALAEAREVAAAHSCDLSDGSGHEA
ncbi:hypothetical protein L615_006600000180 [Nocardioides sp. J9]|uniref:hypothetical protein n=1 Tax=Nocardioides sp. J9 TaxID=935844 RepID=UPI00119CCE44|nr:hypothetical protein [Nocardioides sp. J9]TWG93059.1 hypothetical protein L615_006600000180 [Nocardioides sp. J9]